VGGIPVRRSAAGAAAAINGDHGCPAADWKAAAAFVAPMAAVWSESRRAI
jgi:hypothetical protein